jgi:hypothetical protein
MKFRTYTPLPEAVAQARSIGLFGDTGKRLSRMARRASAVKSDHGNWRFFEFFLTIDGEHIVNVFRL